MSLLPFCLAILAFGLFGLATDAHHRRHAGRPLPAARRTRWRTVAWLSLLAAFPLAIAAQGWVFGPILWTGAVMTGAAVAFLSLNLLPARR